MPLNFSSLTLSDISKGAETLSKKALLQVAKTGIASFLLGYCVSQLSGANPRPYALASQAVLVGQVADGILCNIMLSKGEATATKKALALNLSFIGGFCYFYLGLGILGEQQLRKEIIERIVDNGFAYKVAFMAAGTTALLLASDFFSQTLGPVQSAAKQAMQFRAEGAWINFRGEKTPKQLCMQCSREI